MIARLQKKYALSRQGAMDLIKGCAACVFQNITFMIPAGLLYMLVRDLLGGGVSGARTAFYIAGCVVCVGLILLSTWFQYNATYFATYTESGVRRITLAEKLRKIPLSFFGKKDLADPDQHHHGGLHVSGTEFFAFYTGAVRLDYFHTADLHQPLFH